MRYIVELPNDKAQAIKSLIDSEKYEDTQSFIMTAIENQLYLEKQPLEQAAVADFSTGKSVKEETYSLPVLMLKPTLKLSDIVTVQEPQPEALSSEILWALHNRLFPIKASLRVLLNILKSNPSDDGYTNLTTVQNAAVEEIRKLNRTLAKVDKKHHRMRGEKLSTGLPRASDRSSSRFKFQFVGSINSRNRLDGAPAILHFVNMRKDEEGQPQIGITKSGFEFAIMENPVLDKADYTHALSEEESDFYLRHISKSLWKEYSLTLNTLKAIKNGQVTPNELTQVIFDTYSNAKKEEAQTILSSLVSRLAELGLLIRKRSGLNVKYSLTQKGEEIHNTNVGERD